MARRLATFWNSRSVRWIAVLGWMGVIFALSSRPDLPDLAPQVPHLEEVAGHLAVFGMLAVLLARAFQGCEVSHPAAWALILAVLYGVSDEYHQSFVPNRSMSVTDLGIDLIGACVGLTLAGLLRRMAISRRR